jgi:hypothetical protein
MPGPRGPSLFGPGALSCAPAIHADAPSANAASAMVILVFIFLPFILLVEPVAAVRIVRCEKSVGNR